MSYKVFERDVVRSCINLLKMYGVMGWRCNNAGIRVGEGNTRYAFHGMKGIPDIIAILPPTGHFLGIECKAPGGKQSDNQLEFEANCVKAGGTYLLVDDVQKLADYLSERRGK